MLSLPPWMTDQRAVWLHSISLTMSTCWTRNQTERYVQMGAEFVVTTPLTRTPFSIHQRLICVFFMLEILKTKTNRWSYRDRAATGAMTAVTRQPQRRPTRHKRRHANWSWMKRRAVTAASSSGKWVVTPILLSHFSHYLTNQVCTSWSVALVSMCLQKSEISSFWFHTGCWFSNGRRWRVVDLHESFGLIKLM